MHQLFCPMHSACWRRSRDGHRRPQMPRLRRVCHARGDLGGDPSLRCHLTTTSAVPGDGSESAAAAHTTGGNAASQLHARTQITGAQYLLMHSCFSGSALRPRLGWAGHNVRARQSITDYT